MTVLGDVFFFMTVRCQYIRNYAYRYIKYLWSTYNFYSNSSNSAV